MTYEFHDNVAQNVTVIPPCLCSHVPLLHFAEVRECRAPGCGCLRYRAKEAAK